MSSLLHSFYLHFQLGMVKEADSPPTTQTISEAIMEKEEVNQSTSQSQKSQAVMEWLLGNQKFFLQDLLKNLYRECQARV